VLRVDLVCKPTLKLDTLSHKGPLKGRLVEEVGSKLDAQVTPTLGGGCVKKENKLSKCISQKFKSLARVVSQRLSKCDILCSYKVQVILKIVPPRAL